MSFIDKAKDALTGAVDKAGDLVDQKTGGKYTDQIDSGAEKAKDALDGLDGQDDDIA